MVIIKRMIMLSTLCHSCTVVMAIIIIKEMMAIMMINIIS